jgi:hypothetical protein
MCPDSKGEGRRMETWSAAADATRKEATLNLLSFTSFDRSNAAMTGSSPPN